MHWASFQRARRFGSPPLASRLSIYVASVAAALLILLLILTFGAITDLATGRGNLSIDGRNKDDVQKLTELAGAQMRAARTVLNMSDEGYYRSCGD